MAVALHVPVLPTWAPAASPVFRLIEGDEQLGHAKFNTNGLTGMYAGDSRWMRVPDERFVLSPGR